VTERRQRTPASRRSEQLSAHRRRTVRVERRVRRVRGCAGRPAVRRDGVVAGDPEPPRDVGGCTDPDPRSRGDSAGSALRRLDSQRSSGEQVDTIVVTGDGEGRGEARRAARQRPVPDRRAASALRQVGPLDDPAAAQENRGRLDLRQLDGDPALGGVRHEPPAQQQRRRLRRWPVEDFTRARHAPIVAACRTAGRGRSVSRPRRGPTRRTGSPRAAP